VSEIFIACACERVFRHALELCWHKCSYTNKAAQLSYL